VENTIYNLLISKAFIKKIYLYNSYEKELILCGSEDEKAYIWDKVSNYIPQINPM